MKKRMLILAGGAASRMKKKAENLNLDAQLIEQADTLTKGMIGVGTAGKSLIDYQLFNAHLAGFSEVLLLLHPEDTFTQAYYEDLMEKDQIWQMKILFARQHLPDGRVKPAGTADAVCQALEQHPEWQCGRLLILNSDNLYSTIAMKLLWSEPASNALISYDREALEFPEERIRAFAVIEEDVHGFLHRIVEKPEDEFIRRLLKKTGRVGVSMNAFMITAEQVLPYLRCTPFHPVRLEKELPTTISMLVAAYPEGVKCISLAEHVPDLTSKYDLVAVRQYLLDHCT